MENYNRRLGAKGERLALTFLRRCGYQIIAKNFSCRLGEIDIIAREGPVTVFVEVKARSSVKFGLPQDAISTDKIRHLRQVAQFYINHYAGPEAEFRFDVVSILLDPTPQIQLIPDAF